MVNAQTNMKYLYLASDFNIKGNFRKRGVEYLLKIGRPAYRQIQMGYQAVNNGFVLRYLAVLVSYVDGETTVVFDVGDIPFASEEEMTEASFVIAEKVLHYNNCLVKFFKKNVGIIPLLLPPVIKHPF